MFKKGDIVVRTDDKSTPINKTDKYHLIGAIFKCLNDGASVSYQKGTMLSRDCRKATDNEIKWFEAGITNINQIPEVGGTFDFVDEDDDSQNCKEIIRDISMTRTSIYCSTDNYDLSNYATWLKNNNVRNYKPPIKSQHVGNEVPIDTPFEPGDLKNCKIGYLTPEDHEIIQPFLFSLGYTWINSDKISYKSSFYLKIHGGKYIKRGGSLNLFNNNKQLEIKKETILNYIKQLNTNNNYEVHRQNQEITRRTINGSSRILSGRQQGSTGSRPKGNISCLKGRTTYFRQAKICGSVRFG